MKSLRSIRIILSLIFFGCAVAYLLTIPAHNPIAAIAERVQIIPSALAVTLGVTGVWLIVTLILGRVYCSSVCPIGTLQDMVIPVRRRRRLFRYRPASSIRYHILAIYVVCLIVGVVAVPYWIEPWNIMRNICSVMNPTAVEQTWMTLGIGMATGIASGILSLLLMMVCAFFTGRGFCTDICPIGTALGMLHGYTLMHIEIDPSRCTGCMKCEDICKSQCVKVISRHVDNSRCVRCFDCVSVCEEDAIRFQMNHNRPVNPLMQKRKIAGNK